MGTKWCTKHKCWASQTRHGAEYNCPHGHVLGKPPAKQPQLTKWCRRHKCWAIRRREHERYACPYGHKI